MPHKRRVISRRTERAPASAAGWPIVPEGEPHDHACPGCRRSWRCTVDRWFCLTVELHCDDCWPAERKRRLAALARHGEPAAKHRAHG